MENIYSALYDLFNQNFSVSGNRRYCRIAIGSQFNPRCFVQDNFHAIVLLDGNENTMLKTDSAFLNRFEKHYLTLEHLLTNENKESALRLQKWTDSILC